jgi:hypothetical protein
VATVKAFGPGSLADSAEFIPYVYGATSGRPSRGRPEKVLANPGLPKTPLQRLASMPDTAPARPGRSRTAGCGTPSGARRHYRDREKPCEACLEAARKDRAARDAAAAEELCGKRMTARRGGGVRVCARKPHKTGPCRSADSLIRRSGRRDALEVADEEVAS